MKSLRTATREKFVQQGRPSTAKNKQINTINCFQKFKKKKNGRTGVGTSLEVQWLKLHASNEGVQV